MTFEVVRADDPRCAVLEADGWTVVGESWGARLRSPDPARLDQAVRRATGVVVRELGPSYAEALHALEKANEADYPYTPATQQVVGSLETMHELWTDGRVFGALDGDQLVGATNIRLVGVGEEQRAETGFTSVLAGYRGRGIGQAVKALSILTLYADGVRVFGTGGAALNAASLGANESLGYVVEERWRSYAPPAD
ncbi:GNAT family N-acetyltransferase [Kribbella sp. DT2]|uniref:GNAT family N-acetyltransferase n=1 Tax=Kribbella sp. DT2 TaxID=3393427 RepID=UPI003CEFD8B0